MTSYGLFWLLLATFSSDVHEIRSESFGYRILQIMSLMITYMIWSKLYATVPKTKTSSSCDWWSFALILSALSCVSDAGMVSVSADPRSFCTGFWSFLRIVLMHCKWRLFVMLAAIKNAKTVFAWSCFFFCHFFGFHIFFPTPGFNTHPCVSMMRQSLHDEHLHWFSSMWACKNIFLTSKF